MVTRTYANGGSVSGYMYKDKISILQDSGSQTGLCVDDFHFMAITQLTNINSLDGLVGLDPIRSKDKEEYGIVPLMEALKQANKIA